jgi:CBS domain containing-hemolysin-like protein
LGQQHHDRVALAAAPVARVLRRVLGPLSYALVALGNAVTPGKGFRDGPFQSESELRDLLDRASDSLGHRGRGAGDDPLGVRAG